MKNAENGSGKNPFAQRKTAGLKAFLKGAPVLAAIAFAFLCFLLFPQAVKAEGSYNTNLVVNPNAEMSYPHIDGWSPTSTGFFVLEQLSNPDPYSENGGNTFTYYPGYSAADTIYQTIDISNLASDITAGAVSIHVSASTRKLMSSSMNAIQLECLDDSENVWATYSDSGTIAGYDLLWETLTIDQYPIPSQTRKIRLKLVASIGDADPEYDFVQFDGISLTLTKTIQSITSATVSGIVAPVAGAIPITYTSLIPGSSDYTVTDLDWYHISGNPPHWVNGRFRAEYSYMAIIELTASAGCKFTSSGGSPLPVNEVYAGNVYGGDVEGNRLLFTVVFPDTQALSVTGITTTSQPAVLSFIEGQPLNLTGLQVTLTYNDTSTATVGPDQFAAKGITADPANGTIMTMANQGQQVSLTANGHTANTSALTIVPATYTISASPASLDFGSAVVGYEYAPDAQTVTILNTGNSPVTLTQPTSTNYVLGALSQTTVNAGASATFTIQPKMGLNAGTYSENITVTTNHSTSTAVNAAFTVDALSYTIEIDQDSLDFGSEVEGYDESAVWSQFAMFTNTGNQPVTIDAGSSPLHYDINGFFPITLDPGWSTGFNVKPKTGLTEGTYDETFTLVTDHSTSASVDLRFTVDAAVYSMEASPLNLDLGSMVAGSTYYPPMIDFVELHSTGNANMTVITPTSEHFDIIPFDSSTLYPGWYLFYHVVPKTGLAAGTYNETITFVTTNARSASVNVSFTVEANTYTVDLIQDSLSFGSVMEGYAPAPDAQHVAIINTGNTDVTLNFPTSEYFDITPPETLTLFTYNVIIFQVQPKTGLAAGTYDETITISTTNGTSDSVDVSFTVQAATYTISADPVGLLFISRIEGYASAPAAQTVTITNTGNSGVTIPSAPTTASYNISGTFPMTIAAGGTGSFTAQPKTGLAAGTYDETITVDTDQSTTASFDVSFAVIDATYTIEASTSNLDFGSCVVGYASAPAAQTVTLTNTGNSSVTIPSAPTAASHDISGTFPMTIAAGSTGTFTIQPKTGILAGSYNETITVDTDQVTSASFDVTFTVEEATYTIISGPDTMNFGTVIEGYICAPMVKTMTIVNMGNSSVTIAQAPLSVGYDISGTFPMTIAPASTGSFTIAPKIGLLPGTYDETITVDTDESTSASVSVSFTVVDAVFTIEASPDNIDLGSMVEGSAVPPMGIWVTVSATGNSGVTFASAPASTAFRCTTSFPVTIGPGMPGMFRIEPVTTLAAGVYNETLVFQTEQGTSASVSATFTVEAATYTISANMVNSDFGSIVEGAFLMIPPQPVVITNTGNSDVTIPSAPTAVNYDIGGPFPMTIPAGGSNAFFILPKAGLLAGTYDEIITVTTGESTSASFSVAFTVLAATRTISADPVSLDFGSLIEGYPLAPEPQPVLITNTGNSGVTVTSVPAASNYDIMGPFPITVPSGGTFLCIVQPKAGLSAGTYNETITVNTDHATSASVDVTFTVDAATYTISASPASLDFGSMIDGYASAPTAQTVTITNTGNSMVTIPSAPTAICCDASGTFPMAIAAGSTGTFDVQPKTGLLPGTYFETITVSTDQLTSDTFDVTFTVEVATYTIEASPASLDFGSLIEGYASAPAAQTLTVTNTGNSEVTITSAPIAASYDISGTFPMTIAAGSTGTFDVQPKTGLLPGTYFETITVSTDQLTSDTFDVTFAVDEATYTITASPASLNFGSLIEGYALAPTVQTVTITNTGNQPITLVQPTAVQYTVGTLSALSIAPSEEATFTLQPMAGLAIGTYTETLAIEGSNEAAASVQASFTVTPVPTYRIEASPATLSFGSLAEGYIQPNSITVTVTNTGNQSIALYQPGADDYVVGPISAIALVPGGTSSFFIKPKPHLPVGTYNETVEILGSMGAFDQLEVTFTCTEPSDDYEILSGDGSTFQQDDPDPSNVTITANGNLGNFTGLTINGQLVDEDDYDVYQGSTIIVLHQDFLDTLEPGTYTLRFHYTDGHADAGFVVQDHMPPTGDNDALTVFGALTVLCLAALWLLRKRLPKRE